MNRLEDLIREALAEDARQAPPADPVVSRVIAKRPRPRRASWLTAAAVAAVAGAIVAVGITRIGDGGSADASGLPTVSRLVGSGDFVERKLSYAQGSVIHYGDQTIDVSPHEIVTYLQTDDGFVFADAEGATYFTNGDAVAQIGQAVDGYRGISLTADDSGSYAGWIQGNATAIVYDTANGHVVLREELRDGQVDAPLYDLAAIDNGTVYVVNYRTDEETGPPWTHQINAWDLASGTSTPVPPPTRDYVLKDAASGYQAWSRPAGPNTIVNRGSGVDQHRHPWGPLQANPLSPDGSYIATAEATTRIKDRATGRDVTPAAVGRVGSLLQWLDRDRFVYDRNGSSAHLGTYAHELMTCSVSAGTCSVAVELVGPIVYPNGASR